MPVSPMKGPVAARVRPTRPAVASTGRTGKTLAGDQLSLSGQALGYRAPQEALLANSLSAKIPEPKLGFKLPDRIFFFSVDGGKAVANGKFSASGGSPASLEGVGYLVPIHGQLRVGPWVGMSSFGVRSKGSETSGLVFGLMLHAKF